MRGHIYIHCTYWIMTRTRMRRHLNRGGTRESLPKPDGGKPKTGGNCGRSCGPGPAPFCAADSLPIGLCQNNFHKQEMSAERMAEMYPELEDIKKPDNEGSCNIGCYSERAAPPKRHCYGIITMNIYLQQCGGIHILRSIVWKLFYHPVQKAIIHPDSRRAVVRHGRDGEVIQGPIPGTQGQRGSPLQYAGRRAR